MNCPRCQVHLNQALWSQTLTHQHVCCNYNDKIDHYIAYRSDDLWCQIDISPTQWQISYFNYPLHERYWTNGDYHKHISFIITHIIEAHGTQFIPYDVFGNKLA